MPIARGDPGVFFCGPGDIAPWEQDLPAPPQPARRPPARGRWLVLSMCTACGPSYCEQHRRDNWWLENFRPPRR